MSEEKRPLTSEELRRLAETVREEGDWRGRDVLAQLPLTNEGRVTGLGALTWSNIFYQTAIQLEEEAKRRELQAPDAKNESRPEAVDIEWARRWGENIAAVGRSARPDERREVVDHPAHYNVCGERDPDGTSRFEPIKVIEAWGLSFKMGNALKYILRAPHKGHEKEDYEKAKWYLARAAEEPEGLPSRAPQERFERWNRMPARDVSAAWGLNSTLSECVEHIWHNEPTLALKSLEKVRVAK